MPFPLLSLHIGPVATIILDDEYGEKFYYTRGVPNTGFVKYIGATYIVFGCGDKGTKRTARNRGLDIPRNRT